MPERARTSALRLAARGLLAGASLALCLALGAGWARADGLHCRVLDGADLDAAWRRFVADVWPGKESAPRQTKHANPRVAQAIAELLSVLQFVDPYNYADDSPAWMSTEEGRELGREQAKKILLELGRGAAENVWEALAVELRFTESAQAPDKFVPEFRAAQRKLKAALDDLHSLRIVDAEYRAARAEFEALRPKYNTLRALDKEEQDLKRAKIRQRKDEKMLAKIDALLERLALRKTELGDATEMGQQLKGLQERMDERLKVLDQDPKIVQHLGVVDAARKDLEAAQKRSLGLGQGGDVTGGDPAMVTTDDFVDQLHGVLVQMGPEALPVVVRFKGHANKAVRERAQQILGEWERPQYAKAFALAAAEPDPTPVQLKAKAFLKETLKLKAAEALIPALKDAADEEKPALYAALKSIAANDLPDEPAAWEDWLKKIKAGSTPDKPVPEEEEK